MLPSVNFSSELNAEINRFKRAIDHKQDGPITCFVLISRAMDLAKTGLYSVEVCSNGLHECLDEYGFLGPDKVYPTGS